MSWGIVPSVFCGHSIGEFVAAYFAGIFSLPDALKLIAIRGRMISELPTGSMLAVRIPVGDLEEMLPGTLAIAAINSDNLCVVAGGYEDIAIFAKLLKQQQFPNKLLLTSHAFHSAMMDPIIDDFEKIVSTINLNRPPKAIVSSVSGSWLTDDQATDPHYWAGTFKINGTFWKGNRNDFKTGECYPGGGWPRQCIIYLCKKGMHRTKSYAGKQPGKKSKIWL